LKSKILTTFIILYHNVTVEAQKVIFTYHLTFETWVGWQQHYGRF